MQRTPMWSKVKPHMPEIADSVIGEITEGDRALVSSLEGFEDLQLIGKLQLESHHIQKGDVVFAITEGGETSAVIGTILTAAKMYGNEPQQRLYFIYNNPDAKLLAFDRSRLVIQNSSISKINLTTGSQAITGATRMQATSSDFF
jgi:N-acetylmuramic acid 6-phosphate etherase